MHLRNKTICHAHVFTPFLEFFQGQSAGGILLLICTAIALTWANSPWADDYHQLFSSQLSLAWGSLVLSKDLLHWINDGLMALFFLAVGLEIKRELLAGELVEPKQALLPVAAAVGGMVFPALIYIIINPDIPAANGWGIPMSTDIAFALGILALLGERIPIGIKVFLTALAIIDDLGAVLIIALFYSGTIAWNYLLIAAVIIIILILINRMGIRSLLPYSFLGLALWAVVLQSGIHATIAGVLLALTIPARSRIEPDEFVKSTRHLLNRFENSCTSSEDILGNAKVHHTLGEIKQVRLSIEPPLQRIEHAVHPWVSFLIMPLFALANAGIIINSDTALALISPISIGIILGLVLGKQLGITIFAWIAVRTGLAVLPEGVNWLQIHGVACLAGIGFTMSIFVASLAFPQAELLYAAKAGILIASLFSALLGICLLSIANKP